MATRAPEVLSERGRKLHIVPQNLVALWVVATRPLNLAETPDIYSICEISVIDYRVLGKPAHDARLVAAVKVHGLTSVLTFDKTGFSRFPGIEVINPSEVSG